MSRKFRIIIALAIVLSMIPSALPPVSAQTIAGSLTFTRGDDNAFSALVDQAHGFAYFATDTSPGLVIKVRLSDFTRVGSLVFSGPGEQFSSSAVIDTGNGFAYFGSFFSSRIEKVRLSDFTEVASISVKSRGFFGLTTAVIDSVNGFAYFGDEGGTIVKIRLSDFTAVGRLALPNGGGLFGSTIDNNNTFAYFSNGGSFNPTSTIYQIRLSNFTIANTLTVGQPLGPTPLFDPNTGLSYWPTLTDPGSILRIHLPDLSVTGNMTLNPGESNLNSGLIDPSEEFAYIATSSQTEFGTPVGHPSEIIKINLTNFKRTSTLTLNPYEALLFLSAGSVLQTDTLGGTFGLFSTYTSPSVVVKVKLSSMSRAATLTLQQGQEFFDSSVIDTQAGFVYFGTDTTGFGSGNTTGAITRIRTSDFSPAGTLVLSPGEGGLCSVVIDTLHGFAYFGTNAFPAHILKIRLSDFTRVGDLTLNTGEDSACSAIIDLAAGFAYFGTTGDFPGGVVKINLSTFSIAGSLTFMPGEDAPASAVIDTSSGFGYFGTSDFPGVVVKVRLSDLTEVASITLNPGEDSPPTAVIDPPRGFAYFGTFDANVVRIRLSDFTENATLALTLSPIGFILSSAIDTVNGNAYFGGSNGFISKVQLSTFTETNAISTTNPPTQNQFLGSASIDVGGRAAYFGVRASPGIVYKVSL